MGFGQNVAKSGGNGGLATVWRRRHLESSDIREDRIDCSPKRDKISSELVNKTGRICLNLCKNDWETVCLNEFLRKVSPNTPEIDKGRRLNRVDSGTAARIYFETLNQFEVSVFAEH